MRVIKRDKKRVNFEPEKVLIAIKKGFDDFDNYDSTDINLVFNSVIDEITRRDGNVIAIETIQNIIEDKLITLGYQEVQREFSAYRERRATARKEFGQTYGKMTKALESITRESSFNNDKRENANVDGDTAMGTMLQIGSTISREYAKAYQISPKFVEAHDQGKIHMHDLDFVPEGTLTCCQINLKNLFTTGFNTGHGFLRTPNSIESYSSLAAIAIQANQNEQHGGQSIPLFDYYLAPGVLKTYKKQLKQILYDFFELKGFLSLVSFEKIIKSIDSIKSIDEFPSELDKFMGNEELSKTILLAKEKSLQRTERSTYQAMEAIIHNLNTMHCLPYDEELWVYDGKLFEFSLMKIGELTDNFEKGRYYAISYNVKKGIVETKEIVAAVKKDNHRRLLTLISEKGQKVRVTDNHRILSKGLSGPTYYEAVKATELALPRGLKLPMPSRGYKFSKYAKGGNAFGSNKVGVEMTEELATFMALYIMSGELVGAGIICADYSVCSKLYKIASKLFDAKLESKCVILLPTVVTSFLQAVIGSGNNKKVPFEIIAGANNIKRAFLKTIFSYSQKTEKGFEIFVENNNILSYLNLMFIGEGRSVRMFENRIELTDGQVSELGIDKDDFISRNRASSNEVRFLKISEKKVTNSNDGYVYDISVMDNENFMTRDGIIVHNSRAGAQVPFSSVNFGTDISSEGRMVIKSFLLALDAGLGNGETAIFPISIFKVKEGVNYNEGDPNHDLFKLACKVSAKRLFPNFSFLDSTFNSQYYNESNPDTEVAYMGCVDGEEEINYVFDNVEYRDSFESIWKKISNLIHIENVALSEIINVENRLKVFDSSRADFVKCKHLIRNNDIGNWYRVKFSDETELYATEDHPLPIITRGRIEIKDLNIGDECYKPVTFGTISIVEIECVGFRNRMSYDVETETDRFDLENVQSHNCRTRVIGNVADTNRQIVTGRGNLSFTSINLPRIALNNKNDLDAFFAELECTMDLVKGQLLERYAIQGKKKVKNFPFLMGQGVWIDSEHLKPNDKVKRVLKHGSLTFGFIGLAECLKVLTGKHHGESDESQKLGLKIIGFMRELADKYADKYSLNFSIIATPAEGLSYRFTRIDKALFGEIEGVTDREYYTNSFHVPVYYNTSIAHKLEIEGPYHAFTNAGHISYVELDGDVANNVDAFEKVIRLMKESDIGYGAINHPVDRCPVCGYSGVINDTCPGCNRTEADGKPKFERIRRITGYLVGTLDKFNDGKAAEESDRVKHKFE